MQENKTQNNIADNAIQGSEVATLPFKEMETALKQAVLTYTYESVYEEAKGSPEEKGKAGLTALKEAALEQNVSISLVSVGNVTSVIAYDREAHHATVCFDATLTGGDIWDDIRKGPAEHSLGGHVHGGLYDYLVEKQDSPKFPFDNMVDAVEGHLHDWASRDYSKPLTIDFAGFSSGGSKAAMFAGEMIADGFFDQNSNMKLDNVYTFGALGYSDQDFKKALEENVERLGGKVWHIRLHGDKHASMLTKDSGFFTRDNYEQAGKVIYIVQGDPPKIMINPGKEEIEALPPAPENTHNSDIYVEALSKANSAYSGASDKIQNQQNLQVEPMAAEGVVLKSPAPATPGM